MSHRSSSVSGQLLLAAAISVLAQPRRYGMSDPRVIPAPPPPTPAPRPQQAPLPPPPRPAEVPRPAPQLAADARERLAAAEAKRARKAARRMSHR